MIITIDGPAGAGKSSAARLLARRLGFEFLDTGAMFRAVALAMLRGGVGLDDADRLAALLAGLCLEMAPGRVLLGGEDVTAAIRTPEVTHASSAVAVNAAVRRRLAEMQRTLAVGRDMVCEGRDQGTVVFPDAGCKFFLTADVEERARRRQGEIARRGEPAELAAIRAAIEERDRRDADRDLAPMRPAADAILLDTTAVSLEEVVRRMEAEVRRRMKDQG